MTEPLEEDSKLHNFLKKMEHLLSDRRVKIVVPLVTLALFAVILWQQLIMLRTMPNFLFWFIIIDILVLVGLALPFFEKYFQRILKR